MRKIKDNERAFMKGVAILALEHEVSTTDAQRIFGLFASMAASNLSKLENVEPEKIIERFVAAYAEGMGAQAMVATAADIGRH